MRRVMTVGAFVGWLASLGCAPAIQPGLANAPALGGTTVADTRVHDVIANGQDSCGRRLSPDPGPLRYRMPPCRSESVQRAPPAVSPSSMREEGGGLQWMKHYYFDWPCVVKREEPAGGGLLGWAGSRVEPVCRLP